MRLGGYNLPISRTGLLLALISASVVVLAIGSVAILRHRPDGGDSPLGRVARNSLFPMATSFLNRLLDLAFAVYLFRVLGPEGVGKYTFAVVVLGYIDILANFGLGTLLTREVAADHRTAGRYLRSTLALRGCFWVACLVPLALLLGPGAGPLGIGPDVALAVLLLTLGLLPSLVSATLTALFMAFERFEHPAAVTVLTQLLKVGLGLVALLLGWGFVGLAGVSIVVNLVTMLVLMAVARGVGVGGWGWGDEGPLPSREGRGEGLRLPRFSLHLASKLIQSSYPLMLNNLLNSVFFRVDSLLLKPMAGDSALGWYSTGYKFIDGLGIISSSFTLALFPVLSRYARDSRDSLARIFALALRLMLVVSLPISVGTTLIAPELVLLVAGPDYLPHSAVALQILIWFLPLSFVNGVSQYLLIAIDRQKYITLSFLVATAFNLSANLLLIPSLGYVAAAITTVASEWALMLPFWYRIRRDLPPISLIGLTLKPAFAAATMGVAVLLLRDFSIPLAVLVAPPLYAAALLALRCFTRDELDLLAGLLPWPVLTGRLQRLVP